MPMVPFLSNFSSYDYLIEDPFFGRYLVFSWLQKPALTALIDSGYPKKTGRTLSN
jgi:hypothetical protein